MRMMITKQMFAWFAVMLLSTQAVGAAQVAALADVPLPSSGIVASEDVSGIARWNASLVIVADEMSEAEENVVQIIRDRSVVATIPLLTGDELDLEGVAIEGNTIYAIGSHSSKRKKVKADKAYGKNLKVFRDDAIKDETARDWLYRVTLNDDATVRSKERISLRNLLQHHPVLATFSRLPSKENGVDIEGLAVKNGRIYAGFRGPVFRGNWVPVLSFSFDHAEEDAQLLFVSLEGRGIRGMAEVSDGFLLLAGAVGDGDASYRVDHWDGFDEIPGDNRHGVPQGHVRLIAELAVPAGQKAEGITVLDESRGTYECLIAYDGAEQQHIVQRFRFQR